MSIRTAITYQDKLNELRLDISHPNSKGKVYVLLEGKSDVKLFRKLFNLDNCKVENIPGGNPKLEECVQSLVTNYPLIFGIRDADFLHLEQVRYVKPNLFLTDYHDIEIGMISRDDLFAALMWEYTTLPRDQYLAIRNKIFNSIEQVSYLKWLNAKEGLQYHIKAEFFDLISFTNDNIDFIQYFSRVLSMSPNAKITDLAAIENKISLLQKSNPDLFQLCNGHDFLIAFSHYLRQYHNADNINEPKLVSAWRIAYTFNHYQSTTLYQNTLKWATDNNCVLY